MAPMASDDCPCFTLGLAHRKVLRAFEEALEPLGLTFAQAQALCTLYAGEGVLAKDLARELQVDAGTLTPLLDRLEKQGWVRRCPHPDDRRATRLCLEARAHEQRAAIEAALREASARLMERYTPAEFEALMGLMRRLLEDAPAAARARS